MKKIIIVIACMLFIGCHACQPAVESSPCDQELVELESRCAAGFGLTNGYRMVALCMHGDTADRLRSWYGPDLVEEIEDYGTAHGLDSVSKWGELIELKSCGCTFLNDDGGLETCLIGE